MKVVLPEPEAPISTTTSPRRTSRVTPLRISSSPKALCTSSAWITDSCVVVMASVPVA